MKYGIFIDSSNHGVNYVGKYSDKRVVEICKSYKCLDISNVRKGLPILNNFNFFKVCADTFGRKDQS